jgi:hypothetical protein
MLDKLRRAKPVGEHSMKIQAMKLWTPLLVGLMFAITVNGCRLNRSHDEAPDDEGASGSGDAKSSNAPVVQQQKQGVPSQILKLTLDDSGKLKETLVLRLDYFPAPNASGVSVPSCYEGLSAHLVIGRILCGSNGNIAVDVTVSQVIQQCFTAIPVKIVPAQTAITLVGCKGPVDLAVTKYSPDVKLEVRP